MTQQQFITLHVLNAEIVNNNHGGLSIIINYMDQKDNKSYLRKIEFGTKHLPMSEYLKLHMELLDVFQAENFNDIEGKDITLTTDEHGNPYVIAGKHRYFITGRA